MVYVGVGGNVGDAVATVRAAATALCDVWGGGRMSSIWRTAPVGVVHDQPWFANAVVELPASARAPREILAILFAIERSFGRDRSQETPGGPRTVDLDLLLVGELIVVDADLVVPHPRMPLRAFVLEPLAELAGVDLIIPGVARIVELLPVVRSDRSQTVTRIV